MEAPRQDDPRRFGPYTVLARLRETASAVRYLAHDPAADDPVVITAARPELASLPAFRRRFQAEARTEERLAGDGPRPDVPADAPDSELPWTAGPYVPATALSEAIGFAGPLPEHAVRVLGAGIAETLARVHATGVVFQGLSPRTVLLAEDGPRLTAFGPLGAAASAEARPGGQLSVRLGYLTPEQVEGEEPGPASDLFVLGLLLAYAATGTTPLADGPAAEGAERIARTDPELGAVPEELRDLIARCLAKDPADRPSAETVAAELAPEGVAELAKDGWLPERLVAALAEQEARVRESTASGLPLAAQPEAPAEGTADGTTGTPAEGTAAGAADGTADGTGAATAESSSLVEDTRTTQLSGIGRRVPGTDRPTTQLSVPAELTGPQPGPVPALPTGSGPGPGTDLVPAAPALPALPAGPVPALPAALPPATAPTAPPLPVPAGSAPSPARRPAEAALGRRGLLVGIAAGAAGLLVGGGGVLALGGDGSTDDAKPSPKRSVPRLAGLPPSPRWIYTHPESLPAPLTATLWNDRLLVLTGENGATAVDLRTGRRAWENADAARGKAAVAAGDSVCFVIGPSEFLWLSAENGKVTHREAHADLFAGAPGLTVSEIVGSSDPVVWFTGSHKVTVKAPPPKKGKKRGKDKQVVKSYLFAYDIARRKELWRAPVPNGRGGAPVHRLIALRENDIVVRQTQDTLSPGDVRAAKGKAVFRCFDRKTGKQLWSKPLGSVAPDGAASGDEQGLLYAAVGDDLLAFETPSGKPKWTLNGTGSPFGTPVVSGALLHTANRSQEVGAVERETGRLRWRRSTEVLPGTSAPAVALSTTGRTLLASDRSQVTAFAAQDGRRLWKFQDIGVQDPKGPAVTAPYRVLPTGRLVVVQRDRMFCALPVD
ncbi:PQQ-binding-like beta-propeller repeat protein [Streptomyces sp. NPDC002561]|uniref:outer membrane protein assembly factor BamB family protein n=1 Tax=Streptomyces sp. NPDC002561 TaxID=3154418 RepID=UPI00332AB1AE